MEELKAWIWPKVGAWDHGVRILAKISERYPQSEYASLGMSLQLEWQYLQRTLPGVGSLMGPIEDALSRPSFLQFSEGKRSGPISDKY